MDEKFLEQRLRFIRDLADKADPFIKRRLTDLANNYEAKLRSSRASVLSISIKTPLRDIPSGSPCACRKSNPDIFVLQSAEDGAAKNAPCPLYGAR